MNKTSKHLTVMDGMEAVVTNPECSLHSKLQGLKSAGTLILILITLALALAATACKDKPDDPPPPQPHESTITAFGKTATVIGDAAISTADFNTAVGKLQEAFDYINDHPEWINLTMQDNFAVMMTRTITIVPGNDVPNASTNKALTVCVGWLKSNDPNVIMARLLVLANDNAFADPATPAVPNPTTITQGTPNGLAFDGTVTIRTDDQYTVADWDAVVANVITAFNAAYEAAGNAAKNRFRTVFGNDAGGEIVLVNNFANNWEVRDGEFKTLYLKTGSITTADYSTAVLNMWSNAPEVGKTTLAKDRVFLATASGAILGEVLKKFSQADIVSAYITIA